MPAVGDGSGEFLLSFGGLTFGEGTGYDIVQITGLEDLPDVRTQDAPRVGDDGDSTGVDLLAARTVEVKLEMVGDASTLAVAVAALQAATQPGVGTLAFQRPGAQPRQMAAKCRRRSLPLDVQFAVGVASAVLQFYAPDPRQYVTAATKLSTSPGGPTSGGISPPVTPPVVPGGSSIGGRVSAVNIGNSSTRPVLRVDGPAPGFDLLQLTTGRTLRYRQALAAGEFVVLDTDAKTVLLNGTASRRAFLSGAWWDLPPGSSDLLYQPTGDATGSLFTVTFRSAFV